jgi:hypothetical protein
MSRKYDFEKKFKEYEKKLELFSGGLVKADKQEFVKMLAFYEVVNMPFLQEMADAISGKKLNKKRGDTI